MAKKPSVEFEHSLAEVAEMLFEDETEEALAKGETPPAKPLSNERIRQIEVRALRKIRQNLGLPVTEREMNQR